MEGRRLFPEKGGYSNKWSSGKLQEAPELRLIGTAQGHLKQRDPQPDAQIGQRISIPCQNRTSHPIHFLCICVIQMSRKRKIAQTALKQCLSNSTPIYNPPTVPANTVPACLVRFPLDKEHVTQAINGTPSTAPTHAAPADFGPASSVST